MNYCDRMLPSQLKVSTTFEGKELHGHFVYLSQRDYEVQIDFPFYGISTGLHIPAFAYAVEGYMDENQSISQKGYSSAQGGLVHLYKCFLIFEQHNQEILECYNTEKEIATNSLKYSDRISKDVFHEERKKLKLKLKKEEITSKEYQRELTSLQRLFDLSSELRRVTVDYVRDYLHSRYDVILSISLLPQLLAHYRIAPLQEVIL